MAPRKVTGNSEQQTISLWGFLLPKQIFFLRNSDFELFYNCCLRSKSHLLWLALWVLPRALPPKTAFLGGFPDPQPTVMSPKITDSLEYSRVDKLPAWITPLCNCPMSSNGLASEDMTMSPPHRLMKLSVPLTVLVRYTSWQRPMEERGSAHLC
jgi:hypothetical protein